MASSDAAAQDVSPKAVCEMAHQLPRHAFSVRNAARAGDIWRAFQELAVEASSEVGWPPSRFLAVGTAFVVRKMTVVHHRETPYGEPLRARTWVWRFRRDMISTREVRLSGAAGPLASGTQEWVHIDAAGRPARAPASVIAAFPEHVEDGPITLPDYDERPGERRVTFELRPWHVRMDPLGHANHPAYVDWLDESVSRAMAEGGLDPIELVPVAETVLFRSATHAGEDVTVTTRRVGVTASGAVVLRHHVATPDAPRAAEAVTIRRTRGDDARFAALWD
ncbi:MAG: hypothetical protein KC543_05395 [Myxococcales bacterium]|nr:hypothetical protein [Myxococcales bacterium]